MCLFHLNGISEMFMRNSQFAGNLVKFQEPGRPAADHIFNVLVQKMEILPGYFRAPFRFFMFCIFHPASLKWSCRNITSLNETQDTEM